MHSDKILTEALQLRYDQRMKRWSKVYLATVGAPVLICTSGVAISSLSNFVGSVWMRLALLYGWFIAVMLVIAFLGMGLGLVRHFVGRNLKVDESHTAQLFAAEVIQNDSLR